MYENNYSKDFATLCRNKAKERYKINEIDDMHERTESEISNAIHAGSPLLFLVAHEVIDYCKTKKHSLWLRLFFTFSSACVLPWNN